MATNATLVVGATPPGRRPPRIVLAGFVALMNLLGGVAVVGAGPAIDLLPIASGLAMPTAIAHAGDGSGRLFIALQGGRIAIHDGTRLLSAPFLDIAGLVSCCGERGLLGLAFHPLYATNGRFYVLYTNTVGDVVVARYVVSSDPDRAQTPGVILLAIAHPVANHNGGQLAFGPDGYLYIGVGDGGGAGDAANNAQNLGSLLGKILRIDVDGVPPYAIPPTNPFVGTAGARAEIWAFGLRNPWRFTFDRLTGDLFIGDVGQGAWEEVDFQPASSRGGENYGWRRMEGAHCFNPSSGCNDGTLTLPIIEYPHGAVGANPPDCSVTGGYRYRGAAVPALAGTYVFGDLCSGRILGGTPTGPAWTATPLLDTPHQVSTFGEDEAGELYVAAYHATAGVVYRIAGSGPALHDFDSDSRDDILWRNTSGTLSLWLMNGGSVTTSIGLGTVPAAWAVAAVGDFNGDGDADILWRHQDGTVLLWLMNGGAVTSVAAAGGVDPTWRIAGVGDVSGDGRADIAWRHQGGAVVLWLMNGGAVTSAVAVGAVDPTWQIAGLGDVSGDGKADIAWRHQGGAVVLWLMNGGRVTRVAAEGVVDPTWQIAGLGDVNGDGKADIVWRHHEGAVVLWLMNEATVTSVAAVGVLDPGWQPAALADFNGDGRTDLLWRRATGALAIWLMDGGRVSASLDLGTVSADWTVQ